jgi:hypothetical protein
VAERVRISRFIKVIGSFVAYHCWKDADDDHRFLRSMHRHNFIYSCTVPVNHDNRDIEFFTLQHNLQSFVTSLFADTETDNSCEAFASIFAEYVLATFNVASVTIEVSEDGENSAIITWERNL